ncbi:MAG: YdcF family protein [Chitinophagaceae bacterium]|nr:YdcF family protein [Chitinophagaceae bacterium]MCW5926208.1 YdcF family protein [Chitinophagaceae bacterium]
MQYYKNIFSAGALLFSTLICSCSYTGKATKRLLTEAEKSAPYDIIIVPGYPFENGQWDRIIKGRVYWSKYLYDKKITRNILFSGGAVHSPYYESEIMRMYAIALGIPAENIFTELKAEHSTENVYYGYKKAKKEGFSKIALASDPFQTKMLRSYTKRRVSRSIALIPMVVDSMKLIEPAMIDPIIDFEKAYKANFIPLKKRESFWKRLRGTIRGNIDTTAYR